MEEIIKMAQQVATNIAKNQNEPIDPQNMDMGKVISQVTDSVSKMITPEMIEKMSGGNINMDIENPVEEAKKIKSKIQFDELPKKSKGKNKSKIEELEDDEYDNTCSELEPRTKDLHFTLNVTLEDLYLGKVKKLAVRRKKILVDGKKKSLTEEKKKNIY